MADQNGGVSKVVVTEAGKEVSKEVVSRLARAEALALVKKDEEKKNKRKIRRAARRSKVCAAKQLLGIDCACKGCR